MHTTAILFLASALSAGNAEFDRHAVSNAAAISVARAKAELVSDGPGAGLLKAAMLADPARFVSRAAADPACRALYAAEAERVFARRVAAIRSRLSLGADFAPAFTANDRAAALATFETAFAAERKAACAEQAAQLAGDIRPPMTEVDSDDDDRVRRAIAGRIAARQKAPVFEENLSYISEKMARPMADAAKRERRRQGDYLRRVRSDAAAPSTLAADLRWKLAENIRDRRKKGGVETWWDVFPSVTNAVLKRAVEGRLARAFADRVAETPVPADPAALAREIAADRSAHRTASGSARIFRTAAGARLLAAAKAAAVAAAAARERTELAAFLDGIFTGRAVAKAVDGALAEKLLPSVDAARRQVAARDFAEFWPTLADGRWYPDAETADTLCARGDLRAALRDWRALALAGLSDERRVLEETDRTAADAVRDAFARARNAIAAQTRGVDEVLPAVLAEARARKESFWRRTPDLKALVALLTAAVEAKWREVRVRTLWPSGVLPANAAEQHAGLFPSVRKRIELVARQILDEIVEEEPEKKPEEEDEPALEYTIIVSRKGDAVDVRLEHAGKTVVARRPKARTDEFEKAMRAVSEKLGRDILRLKR